LDTEKGGMVNTAVSLEKEQEKELQSGSVQSVL
jgi:hypothetical protein